MDKTYSLSNSPELFEGSNVSRLDEDGEANKINFYQALMNLLKGNIGIGVLALPIAVSRSGSVVGPILIIFLGILVAYNMITLCECNYKVRERSGKPSLGLAGTVKYSFKPYVSKRACNYIAYLVNGFLLTYQTLGCAAYVLVAAETLKEITGSYFTDIRIWVSLFIVPIILLSLISSISTISIISGCANVLCLFGLFSILSYVFERVKSPANYPYYTNPLLFSSSLTSLIFAYEGMSSMLPIINSMKDKSQYTKALICSNGIAITFYTCIGWLGYLSFGSSVTSPITLGLPFNGFYNCIKIIYGLGVLLSFMVVMYCNITIIMPFIKAKIKTSAVRMYFIEFGFRVVIILAGILMAVLLPRFDDVLSLMGAFGSSPLSLIIPPSLHILIFIKEEDKPRSWWIKKLILHSFIIFIGICLTGVGIFSTISRIIHHSKD